jgi:hypothetical protein
MSGEDGGWGEPVDDGWAAPPSPVGSGPFPPQPGGPAPQPQFASPQFGSPQFGSPPSGGPSSYVPPGAPGPARPGRGGLSPKLIAALVVVVVVVVVVVIVAVVITVVSNPSKPKALPSPSPHTSATASSGFPSSGAPTGGSSSLLSVAPFSGCQQVASSQYSTTSVVDGIGCAGSDVKTGFSADEVDYQKFSSAAALTEWYQTNIIAGNKITANTGDCSTTTVITTPTNAQYCEGSFTDTAGVIARQVLILAPASVVATDNKSSTATACPNAQSYTLLIVTSPSDDVGISALACSGTAQIAKNFEQALLAGTLDLND